MTKESVFMRVEDDCCVCVCCGKNRHPIMDCLSGKSHCDLHPFGFWVMAEESCLVVVSRDGLVTVDGRW